MSRKLKRSILISLIGPPHSNSSGALSPFLPSSHYRNFLLAHGHCLLLMASFATDADAGAAADRPRRRQSRSVRLGFHPLRETILATGCTTRTLCSLDGRTCLTGEFIPRNLVAKLRRRPSLVPKSRRAIRSVGYCCRQSSTSWLG